MVYTHIFICNVKYFPDKTESSEYFSLVKMKLKKKKKKEKEKETRYYVKCAKT